MTAQEKETVIVVHGTWAAPADSGTHWYLPKGDSPAAPNFVSKLDRLLAEKGSPARCWAHCDEKHDIFSWTGNNSWIDRVYAGAALTRYIAALNSEGWTCHIVAHSHGGNVVMQALRYLAGRGRLDSRARYVTLGTPFLDTMSPISTLQHRTYTKGRKISAFGLGNLVGFLTVFVLEKVTNSKIAFFGLTNADLGIPFGLMCWYAMGQWLKRRPTVLTLGECDQLLVVGSPLDEAWQALHHISTISNPLAPNSGVWGYLKYWRHTYLQQLRQVDGIHGRTSFSDLSPLRRWLYVLLDLVLLSFTVVVLAAIAADLMAPDTRISPLTKCLGIFAAAFALLNVESIPWIFRRAKSYYFASQQIITYGVRQRVWPLVQTIALGLDGYSYAWPEVRQTPKDTTVKFVHEELSENLLVKAREQRAHFLRASADSVSEALASAVLTSSDINHLLKKIAADTALVHAAYYTQDECIDRIADWIASIR